MPERRRGALRSETARRAILEATAALFAERGYDHLSIEGIAAHAGVAKQTVYRWWPSKSALIADCLLEGMLLPADLRRIPDTGDLRADLASWLRQLATAVETPGAEGLFRALIAASTASEDVSHRLREGLADPELFGGRLRAAAEAGEIRSNLPVDLIGEMLIGALVFRILTRSPVDGDLASILVGVVLGPAPEPTPAPDGS